MTAEAEIRRRIEERGKITFAEFMEVALYWPEGGYYMARTLFEGEIAPHTPLGGGQSPPPSSDEGPFGAAGDYYTSPLVHPAFGALLSVQLFQMWELLGKPKPFAVVELGCGNGQLARDILAQSRRLPDGFAGCLEYVGVDRRAAAGTQTAGAQLPEEGFRVLGPGVSLQGLTGCVLSNELLDSFPVHQVRWSRGKLCEVYVALEADELVEELGAPSTPGLAERLNGLGIQLEEGQTAEINLGLADWAQGAAQMLEAGFVLTIDYGRPAVELYSARLRPRGSLTTYYRQVQTDAPLRRIGRQDISAQVDFSSARLAGDAAGLETLGLTNQAGFLRSLGWESFRSRLGGLGLAPGELQANRTGMLDLVRPGGLGDFKVMAQSKGVGRLSLWGLEASEEAAALVEKLVPPVLGENHLRLAQGYPQIEASFELDDLLGLGDPPR